MQTIAGIGVGLRMELARELLTQAPTEIAWLEIHPENYIGRGGRYRQVLDEALDHYPMVTHGLTMGFGSTRPYDRQYLTDLRRFLADVGTPWHSDHLCFAQVDGVFVHDLLPLPFNEEAIDLVVQRHVEARDALAVDLAVENVSYYAQSAASESDEATFITEILERADAKLLLDVNNVYVNSRNHGFDPRAYIDRIDPRRVVQIHVAGHFLRRDGLRIDTHAEQVCDDVYDLLEYTLGRLGPVPVLLERDDKIPPLDELIKEVRRLREVFDRATAPTEVAPTAAARTAGAPSPVAGSATSAAETRP